MRAAGMRAAALAATGDDLEVVEELLVLSPADAGGEHDEQLLHTLEVVFRRCQGGCRRLLA